MRTDEWAEYYEVFADDFAPERVRDDCHPRIRTHPNPRGSVVLVHGLSDSPFFMLAIAEHFYSHHHYNVYLPLLQFHGLKDPQGLEGVRLEQWKRNVSWSVEQAAEATPQLVSIGGLSTGGALSLHSACTNPLVTGDVFLFSAALSLLVAGRSRLGDIAERLLRNGWINDWLDRRDRRRIMVGDNPVKYEYIDKDGARELARLILELDLILAEIKQDEPLTCRIFAAHSEADDTADVKGVLGLEAKTVAGNFVKFIINKESAVSHAGLVLAEDLYGRSGRLLTRANVRFEEMLQALDAFVAIRA
ncbi:MAG: hypothetical protein RJQ07_00745 [Pseudomonadales bacterium]